MRTGAEIYYILRMDNVNNIKNESGKTPEGLDPQAGATENTAGNAPDFAKLADEANPEGSSINSEDYWFLKLNGNS